jgi:hypothetical protein
MISRSPGRVHALWPMEMPSETEIVPNSAIPARGMHAVLGGFGEPVERQVARRISFQLEATLDLGLAQSHHPCNSTEHAMGPSGLRPSVMARDLGLMSTLLPKWLDLFARRTLLRHGGEPSRRCRAHGAPGLLNHESSRLNQLWPWAE